MNAKHSITVCYGVVGFRVTLKLGISCGWKMVAKSRLTVNRCCPHQIPNILASAWSPEFERNC